MDDLNDLTPREVATLVTMLQRVVVMDKTISNAEREAVLAISQRVEPGLYSQGLKLANDLQKTAGAIEKMIDWVERPEARELIFRTVLSVAAADEVNDDEMTLIRLLQSKWRLQP
jgi:hypothetical protein